MADKDTVVIRVEGAGAKIPVTINGKRMMVPRDRDVRMPKPFYEVLQRSGYRTRLIEGDGAPKAEEAVEPGIESVTGGVATPATDLTASTIRAKDAEAGPQGITGTQREDLTHSDSGAEQDPSEVDLTADGGTGGDAGASGAENNGDNNDPEADKMIEGTVEDVAARLENVTDKAELARIRAAEDDREKPRKGVLDAITEQEKKLSAE